MGWTRPNARVLVAGAMIFVVGFVAGAVVLSTVASRASSAYLSAAQLAFRYAQNEQASEAWRAGDFESAVGHAFCEVEAEHGLGARRAFRRDEMPWDLFGFALLQKIIIEPNQQIAEKAKPSSEAGARAKLAVAWERLGRVGAANREYAKSVALTGIKDVAKWRLLGLETVDMWSKVQERQTAASHAPASGGDAQPAR